MIKLKFQLNWSGRTRKIEVHPYLLFMRLHKPQKPCLTGDLSSLLSAGSGSPRPAECKVGGSLQKPFNGNAPFKRLLQVGAMQELSSNGEFTCKWTYCLDSASTCWPLLKLLNGLDAWKRGRGGEKTFQQFLSLPPSSQHKAHTPPIILWKAVEWGWAWIMAPVPNQYSISTSKLVSSFQPVRLWSSWIWQQLFLYSSKFSKSTKPHLNVPLTLI